MYRPVHTLRIIAQRAIADNFVPFPPSRPRRTARRVYRPRHSRAGAPGLPGDLADAEPVFSMRTHARFLHHRKCPCLIFSLVLAYFRHHPPLIYACTQLMLPLAALERTLSSGGLPFWGSGSFPVRAQSRPFRVFHSLIVKVKSVNTSSTDCTARRVQRVCAVQAWEGGV